MSLEGWKAFFEIGGVVLLAATFIFGAGALIVNGRINRIGAAQLADFKLRFEGEQQKTARAQQEAAEAKTLAGSFERDIATANQAAAEANERAAKAQESLGLAEQHAAEATTKAEGFRLNIAEANARAAEAKLELEKLKMPRQLSAAQQDKIASVLAAWAGQRFSFSVAGDAEALSLLNTLRSVFAKAGWVKESPTGFGDINVGDAAVAYGTGVIVRFSPSASPETIGIAKSWMP